MLAFTSRQGLLNIRCCGVPWKDRKRNGRYGMVGPTVFSSWHEHPLHVDFQDMASHRTLHYNRIFAISPMTGFSFIVNPSIGSIWESTD